MYGDNENTKKCYPSGLSSSPDGCEEICTFIQFIQDVMLFLAQYNFYSIYIWHKTSCAGNVVGQKGLYTNCICSTISNLGGISTSSW